MKPSESTEMDRLLRRYSRRNTETVSGEDGQAAAGGGAHMDADELNAYAEGALPEAARARYFAHLADCDACRRLVTELTLASGQIGEKEQAAEARPTPSKSWREWLAELLSPPVLRYAVPALALLGVIVVAVVVMRSRGGDSFVARNSERAGQPAPITPGSNSEAGAAPANTSADAQNHVSANVANSNIAPQATPQPLAQPNTGTAQPMEKTTTTPDQNAPAPPPPLRPADEPAPVVAQKGAGDKQRGIFGEAKSGDQEAASATQQAPVLSTPPATSKPASAEDDIKNKREEQAKTKAPEKDVDETVVVTDEKAGSAGTASRTVANEARRDRAKKAAESPAPNAGARIAVAPEGRAAGPDTEKEDLGGARSVGGRQFRRQGNAWVDTAYNSSRPTTHVARGSEQYRALIADEPGLRAITRQLGGEVFVVWKGRAYRFF